MSSNRTVAKNTLFLYLRMLFTMGVSLYTSRVILQVLGVDDYGIYQVVGGVVGMLSFLNSALSMGTSRFLAYELGAGNEEKLKRTFCTTLTIHIVLGFLILILAETIGLWFVYNKSGVPPERLDAAIWAYHFSVLSAVILIMQVPYNALIYAHEKMNVFAYASIVEVSAKLLVVYLLTIAPIDKLKAYSVLLCIVQSGSMLFYFLYSKHAFKEARRYTFIFDKEIFKAVGSLSGWNLFTNASLALNSQGLIIITNLFFNPEVVAARAISVQVDGAAKQLVNNFRVAVNPLIIKRFASNEEAASKALLLDSARVSFYLMLILGLPVMLLAEPLLHLWLGVVPEYTVIFLQLIIIQSLLGTIDSSFYAALYTKGRLKEESLISPLVGFIQFPIIYLLFKNGYSPLVLSYVGIVMAAILTFIIKPILVHRIVGFTVSEIVGVFVPCFKVCLAAYPIPLLFCYWLDTNIIYNFIIVGFVSVLCVVLSAFFFGITGDIRRRIIFLIRQRLKK